jgi:hypothetical protein
LDIAHSDVRLLELDVVIIFKGRNFSHAKEITWLGVSEIWVLRRIFGPKMEEVA